LVRYFERPIPLTPPAGPTSPGQTSDPSGHDPVMIREVLAELLPPDSTRPKTIVDCTLGRGGHARLIADRLDAASTLICLDRDPRNLAFARTRFEGVRCNVRFFEANFAQLGDVLEAVGTPKVDGMLADLGISTNQLFDAAYGLSFQHDGPLDMRLSPDEPDTAERIVNTWGETELANLIYDYADERYSRRIARKIAEERALRPITTSGRLADIVRSAVPRVPRSKRSTESIDPATRTFLALRMKVNGEAENLESLLRQAPSHLAPRARLVIISFHSTEDRIVKNRLREFEAAGRLNVLTRRPLVPLDDEIAANPRSRSSKMRVAEGV
jgi:16S rRNA (cytosine1402-N4)-methyltransferase